MSRKPPATGSSRRFGNRNGNGLCPNQSRRGRRPLGSRMKSRKAPGFTSPPVQVMPPITMFRRETLFSAT